MIAVGSNVTHAAWMGVFFCGSITLVIEEEWNPMDGTNAVECPGCQAGLANWLLLTSLSTE